MPTLPSTSVFVSTDGIMAIALHFLVAAASCASGLSETASWTIALLRNVSKLRQALSVLLLDCSTPLSLLLLSLVWPNFRLATRAYDYHQERRRAAALTQVNPSLLVDRLALSDA